MTDYTSNPFFQSPYIAQAGNNLIKAFNDDGRSAENAARTKLLNAQTEKQTGENAGREATASAIQGQDFSAPAIANQFWSGLAANGIRSGQDPSQVARAVMFLRANSKASDADIASAVVGAKGGLGVNEGVSLGDRNAITQKSEDAAMARTSTSAGIAAGASRANNADTLAFHERHAFDAPIQVAPEHAVYPNANDPRMKGIVPGSMPVPRMVTAFDANSPTKASRQEDRPGVPTPIKSEHLITQFDATSPTGGVRALDAPGVIPIAPEKPPHIINEKAVGQIEMDALGGLGVWDAANGGANPTFAKEYAKQMEAARIASADTLQKTGNAGLAQKAYIDALGIQPGSDVSVPGMIGRMRGKGVEVTPPGGAAPAPAGTAQAAPSIANQFAPPSVAGAAQSAAPPPPPADPAQRKPGVYTTPKGPMTWTGSGWLPPAAANDGAR